MSTIHLNYFLLFWVMPHKCRLDVTWLILSSFYMCLLSDSRNQKFIFGIMELNFLFEIMNDAKCIFENACAYATISSVFCYFYNYKNALFKWVPLIPSFSLADFSFYYMKLSAVGCNIWRVKMQKFLRVVRMNNLIFGQMRPFVSMKLSSKLHKLLQNCQFRLLFIIPKTSLPFHYSENKFTVPFFRKLLLEEVSIFVVWLGRFAPAFRALGVREHSWLHYRAVLILLKCDKFIEWNFNHVTMTRRIYYTLYCV